MLLRTTDIARQPGHTRSLSFQRARSIQIEYKISRIQIPKNMTSFLIQAGCYTYILSFICNFIVYQFVFNFDSVSLFFISSLQLIFLSEGGSSANQTPFSANYQPTTSCGTLYLPLILCFVCFQMRQHLLKPCWTLSESLMFSRFQDYRVLESIAKCCLKSGF